MSIPPEPKWGTGEFAGSIFFGGGSIDWHNSPIVAVAGRVCNRVAGTFLELPVGDQTAVSKPLFGRQRSNVWPHDAEKKNTQDKCLPRYPSRARLLHVLPQNSSK